MEISIDSLTKHSSHEAHPARAQTRSISPLEPAALARAGLLRSAGLAAIKQPPTYHFFLQPTACDITLCNSKHTHPND